MPANPLLDFADLPDFSAVQPAHAEGAVDAVLSRAQENINAIARDSSPPQWENTFAPLQDVDESVDRVWSQVEHLHNVDNEKWRQAHRDNLGKISAFSAELGQNAELCARLRLLAESPAEKKLPPHRKKALADALRDFELSGVNLPEKKRAQFRANVNRLAELSAKFEENLLDSINDFHMDVADESRLGEMPDDLKAMARAAAEKNKVAGFRFTLHGPSYAGFITYSPDRELREKIHRAKSACASELGPAKRDNTPVMAEVLKLRLEQAKLLGRESYAQCALESRMAETPARVLEFIRDFAARARPRAEEEFAELRDFAASELDMQELQPWDVAYASEKLRRRKFDFAESDLRPYLREDKVVAGLFAFAESVFGVRAEAAEARLWAPEAKFFVLKNAADGAQVGRVFMDLPARETKRGGAWMAAALGRVRRCNGEFQLPAAHMNCNFSRQTGGRPALLGWDEAVTLFHEFGHALHHLLTERDDYAVSGINGVEWDAVEWPSQLMENFIWDYQILAPLTAHEKTGEPMPEALFKKALAARKFQAGMFLCRQLEFALFDMFLHSADPPPPYLQALAAARAETRVAPTFAEDRFPCGFSHIFAGGYAAGYYSYLWAEALAADSFALFAEGGAARFGEAGMKFRREALAVGGGRPAMESFRAFRGRAPQPGPLLAQYGLE